MAPNRREISLEVIPIDYREVITQHPWIVSKNQSAIISPDSDGFLCGLLLTNYLNWRIVGFYNGKLLLLQKGLRSRDCIFLDVEIFRSGIRSIGQHMLLYNKNQTPTTWDRLKDCLQPNNLRHYDALHDFQTKYPLATIHLLLGLIGTNASVAVPDTAIAPLFFTDGSWQNLLRYPENCLNWLSWLGATTKTNPLYSIFYDYRQTLYESMLLMYKFYRERDGISVSGETGDQLKLSQSNGDPFNITKHTTEYSVDKGARSRAERFVRMIGGLTGWHYEEKSWPCWENLSLYRFTKDRNEKLTGAFFNQLTTTKNALSLAITGGKTIEYTLETPDQLP